MWCNNVFVKHANNEADLYIALKGKGKGQTQQAVEMALRGPGRLRPRNT